MTSRLVVVTAILLLGAVSAEAALQTTNVCAIPPGALCIDPAFGPTIGGGFYWSSTLGDEEDRAHGVAYYSDRTEAFEASFGNAFLVRAVRNAF